MSVIWVAIAFGLAQFAINGALALAVARNVSRLTRDGRDTVLVEPFVSPLVVLLGGPLVALAYWILHRSALASSQSSGRPTDGGQASN
jgi:hypothetical protein